MFRNMVTSLLEHEQIFTTVPKAKELRRWADWMVTLGKQGDLHARRQSAAFIRKKSVVHKLFVEIAPRFQERPGGYTRIVKVGFRRGDASPMCLIELVGAAQGPAKKIRHKAQPEDKAATPNEAESPRAGA
jgi:large subunit ribosomal protein L17